MVTELLSGSLLACSSSFKCISSLVVIWCFCYWVYKRHNGRLLLRKPIMKQHKLHLADTSLFALQTFKEQVRPSSLLPVLCCKGLSLKVRPAVHHPAQPVIS